MLRLTAYVTIFCFLTVSALGNGCGLVCVHGLCQITDDHEPEPDQPLSSGSCCPSQKSASNSPCHQKHQVEHPQHRPCGSAPMHCSGASCLPDATIVHNSSSEVDWKPDETRCGHCIKPHLEFTLGEKKGATPRSVLAIGSSPTINTYDLSVSASGERNRPGEIHRIISTTILRL